jgi:hypothetical protein
MPETYLGSTGERLDLKEYWELERKRELRQVCKNQSELCKELSGKEESRKRRNVILLILTVLLNLTRVRRWFESF